MASVAVVRLGIDEYRQLRRAERLVDALEQDVKALYACGTDCESIIQTIANLRIAFDWLHENAFDEQTKQTAAMEDATNPPATIPSILSGLLSPAERTKFLEMESLLLKLHPHCEALRDSPFPCPQLVAQYDSLRERLPVLRRTMFPHIVDPVEMSNG